MDMACIGLGGTSDYETVGLTAYGVSTRSILSASTPLTFRNLQMNYFSVLEDDSSKNPWKSSKTMHKEILPSDESSHNHLQIKYGSFKEVDEETEELKADPSDWGSHCLITPRSIHLARISDTESEKNSYSPPPFANLRRDLEFEVSKSNSSRHVPFKCASSSPAKNLGDRSQFSPTSVQNFSMSCHYLTAKSPGDCDSHSEQNMSYKSATEGSVESLDRYETAIRDEELTFSDEKHAKDIYCFTKSKKMETFSEFEEDLRHRVTKNMPSSSNAAPSSQHSSISDYIDRDKHSLHTYGSSLSELNNSSSPGSPNISRFKYKGTKGFGRTPRMEYCKREEADGQISEHSQSFAGNSENMDEPPSLGS